MSILQRTLAAALAAAALIGGLAGLTAAGVTDATPQAHADVGELVQVEYLYTTSRNGKPCYVHVYYWEVNGTITSYIKTVCPFG